MAYINEKKVLSVVRTVPVSNGADVTQAVAFAESERQKSKNLFDINKSVEITVNCTYTTTSASNTITATKTNADEVTISRIALKLANLIVGKTYTISIGGITFSGSASGGASELAKLFVGDDNNPDTGNYGYITNDSKSLTITATGTDLYIKKYLSYETGESSNTITNIQVEEGSVATDFQPYNGAIVREGKVGKIMISQTPVDINTCTTYQQVYNMLTETVGVGSCGIGVNHTNAIKSLLPTFPINIPYIDCVAKLEKTTYPQSINMWSIRFSAYSFGYNQSVYYCDVTYDGQYTIVSGWYKPEVVDVIYDMSSSDSTINHGFTSGIQFDDTQDSTSNLINVDTDKYDHFIVTVKSKSNVYSGVCKAPYSSVIGSNLYLGNSIVANNLLITNTYIRPIDCYQWTTQWTNCKNNSDFVVTKIEGVK